ncbi:hypothetical protein [Floridanema evergladense]|uniref:Uncharacterized protein n=1 Tax=Floridaenema evergladense BLCC-F167 TaxID=3153639 RepID=A0ABV4WJD2_9CYAN
MNLETEQLLGTLQLLIEPPLKFRLPNNHYSSFLTFVWDSEEKGELDILNLSYIEDWIQLTDIEVALKNWQTVENKGSLDPDFDPYYLRRRNKNYAVDEVTRVKRTQKYQGILELFCSELQEVEVLKFSCSRIYSFCVLIGKTQSNDWICISPTVAQETKIENQFSLSDLPEDNSTHQLSEANLVFQTKIEKIIAELEPLTIYGYYGGGYNYSFNYHLVLTGGTTKEKALEKALRQAGMLKIAQFHRFNFKEIFDEETEAKPRYDLLNRFFQQSFSEKKMISCSFWNWIHIYIIGQTRTGDWLGVNVESEFDFNP